MKQENLDKLEEIILIAGELIFIISLFVMISVIVVVVIALTGG